MESTAKLLLIVGLAGLVLAALVNTYVVVGMGRQDAMFFSSLWWTRWFPLYLVMVIAGFVGLVLKITGK